MVQEIVSRRYLKSLISDVAFVDNVFVMRIKRRRGHKHLLHYIDSLHVPYTRPRIKDSEFYYYLGSHHLYSAFRDLIEESVGGIDDKVIEKVANFYNKFDKRFLYSLMLYHAVEGLKRVSFLRKIYHIYTVFQIQNYEFAREFAIIDNSKNSLIMKRDSVTKLFNIQEKFAPVSMYECLPYTLRGRSKGLKEPFIFEVDGRFYLRGFERFMGDNSYIVTPSTEQDLDDWVIKIHDYIMSYSNILKS